MSPAGTLVYLFVALVASFARYGLPDLAASIYWRQHALFTVLSIYLSMPFLFVSLYVQYKRLLPSG